MGMTYFSLDRFLAAQAPVYHTVMTELLAGRKQTHWMWFIFPQVHGLGRSSMSELFAIESLEHARQFLSHTTLRSRLHACTKAVIDADAVSLHAIFGSPDDLKFCSSMTLFHLASEEPDTLFRKALDRWCLGQMDDRTQSFLAIN